MRLDFGGLKRGERSSDLHIQVDHLGLVRNFQGPPTHAPPGAQGYCGVWSSHDADLSSRLQEGFGFGNGGTIRSGFEYEIRLAWELDWLREMGFVLP